MCRCSTLCSEKTSVFKEPGHNSKSLATLVFIIEPINFILLEAARATL